MTVLEAIQKGSDYLIKHKIESPRLQCEWLLSEIMGVPRLHLYLNFEKDLTDSEVSKMRGYLQKRAKGVPFQHLMGKVSFCGIEIRSDSRALIPRSETEFLAEWVWTETLDFRRRTGRPARVLDIGTGSGCIALALAMQDPEVSVVACDLSEEALDLARENREYLGLTDRVKLHCMDLCKGMEEGAFDMIVSNPPYIESASIEGLQVEVRDHDPRMALDGGKDGLEFYRRLSTETVGILKDEGRLFLELGDDQADCVEAIFNNSGWLSVKTKRDPAGKVRYFSASRMGKE